MLFGTIESGSIAKIEVSSVAFSKKTIELAVDEIVYITTSILPKESQNMANLTWEYDKSILYVESADNTGMTIKGLSAGKTALKVKAGDFSDTCVITVTGVSSQYTDSPYIYSSFSFCEIPIGTQSKINVSLYNGQIGDINDFTWSIEDQTVASISASGQYCVINAKAEGFTRIKVTHPKTTYPYYINVLSYGDNAKTPFIYTNKDVLTINIKDTKSIDVTVKNATDTIIESDFSWTIESTESDNPFTIASTGKTCLITPTRSGQAFIKVTHPDCPYPLTILVRIVTIVDNVYIEPSESTVSITGKTSKNISAVLKGTKEFLNTDEFAWSVEDNTILDVFANGENCNIIPIRNGSTYITVTHPAAQLSRRILVICKGLTTDAINVNCYITTTQDYIRTKVGNTSTVVNISLNGGIPGDEANFHWSIVSTPKDGSSDNVIDFSTETGTFTFSRIAASSAQGKGIITPLKEGTAVITLTHPLSYYSTEILISVMNENTILEEPYTISTNTALITMLYGEEKNVSAYLTGNNVLVSDMSKISWTTSCPGLSITANGGEATVKTVSTDYSSGLINVSHPNALNTSDILVLMAATQEELDSKKALYTYTSEYRILQNAEIDLSVIGYNLEEADYSNISWTSNNANCLIQRNKDFYSSVKVTGVSIGTSVITVQSPGVLPCVFNITVLPEDAPIGYEGAPVYLTTTQNVVNIKTGTTQTVMVNLLNGDPSLYNEISWSLDKVGIISIEPSGSSASFTAITDGECSITVTHPKAANKLKINCKTGSEYIIPDTPLEVYVEVNSDAITLIKGGDSFLLQSYLINSDVTTGFDFTTDSSIVSLTTFGDGRCYIKPIEAGQCIITATNSVTQLSKDVVVFIANTEEELKGFSYLTTSQKVVTLGSGSTKVLSVSVVNSSTPIDSYLWTSSNPSIVDVVSSGPTAILYANSIGTAKISVSHPTITYPVEIICSVVDTKSLGSNTYISVNPKLLTLNKSTTWSSINAELVNGNNESDYSNFVWSCADSSIAQLVSEGPVAKIRGIAVGLTTVSVSHPLAKYPEQITVVVDDFSETGCSIDVKESIIDLKPTDGAKSITANLINGSTEDKYNFKWSLDVYDVVDLRYSNNIASITPLGEGECTLTVTHPKAPYSQQIVIRVSEYKNFGFGVTNKTVSESKTAFISMQVPASSVTQHVVYSSENANVCTILGTNQVCQITGIAAGTAKVKAQLVTTATNVVKAEAELLVAVEKNNNLLVYITASQNIYTMETGTNKTLSATLTGQGVVQTDQNNLTWSSSDPSIVSIRGASTTGFVAGSSVFIEAVSAGDAVITVSHEKSASDYTFRIIVPGPKQKTITLNRSVISMTKSNTAAIKATIYGSTPDSKYADQKSIIWEAAPGDGGVEICRILGSGLDCEIYAMAVGTTTIYARLPDATNDPADPRVASCTVTVIAPRHVTLEVDSIKLKPGDSVAVKYSYSPIDAPPTFSIPLNRDQGVINIDSSANNGSGILTITGLKAGTTEVLGINSFNNTDQLLVNCSWDYKVSFDTIRFESTPTGTYSTKFTTNPSNLIASLSADTNNTLNYCNFSVDNSTKTITIKPKGEVDGIIYAEIKNPLNNEIVKTQAISIKFKYDNLTPAINLTSKNGNFSYVSNNIVHLGDEETVSFKVSFTEPNASYAITNAQGKSLKSVSSLNISCDSTNSKTAIITISAPGREVIKQEYLIPVYYQCMTPVLYRDTYMKDEDGNIMRDESGLPIDVYEKALDPYVFDDYLTSLSNGRWFVNTYYYYLDNFSGEGEEVYEKFWAYFGNNKVWPWRITVPSLANTRVDKNYYESKKAWYYPGVGQTGNQPAVLVADDDQTLLSTSLDYNVLISYTHNGVAKTASIPVYFDTRNCNKTVSSTLP